MSFRTTRNLGLITLLVIIFLESLFSYITMSRSSSRLATIITVDQVKLRHWYDVAEIIANAQDHLYDYRAGRNEVVAPVDLLVNKAIKEINYIKNLPIDHDEAANIEEIARTARKLKQAINAYRIEVREGYGGGSSVAEIEQITIKTADRITRLGREAAAYTSEKIEANNKAILEINAFSQKIMAVVIVVAIIATGVVAIIMASALSKPIELLVDGTRKLAEGDLSHRVDINSDDEIGQLANSFNHMAEALKKSSQELIAAKAYTDNIIKSMTNSLVVVNHQGTIEIVNKAACELLEYSEKELLHQPFAMIFAEGHFSGIGLEELIHEGFTSNIETTYQSKNGKKIRVLFSGSVIFDDLGNFEGIVCVAQDITLQAEAMQASHLASIGELAAGVAHEINNPINGIINFAQIIIDDIDRNDPVTKEIPLRIISEGDRIATIVNSLLSFARESETNKKLVKIDEIMTEVLALTAIQIEKDGISMTVDIPNTLPPIVGNFQQIQQIFLNIINNSRYALNNKYKKNDPEMILEITGTEEIIDGRLFIKINVYDQGTGIPTQIIDKVINPFFSTKPAGRGTGLGLAISHGIITDHGGKLIIDSIEGDYTSITILLPAVPDNQPDVQPA